MKKTKTNGTKKMLRAIINGQSALKGELLDKIDKVEANLGKKIEANTERLDKIGSQVAYLEDDVPTRKEHDKLEKRVNKVETTIASI